MSRHLMYLIGEPGVGKSTLMAALVQGKRRRIHAKPFMHTIYEGGLVQLGRERAAFGGTDALGMSVGPLAIAALESGAWPTTVAEGDRLAYGKFFRAAESAGYAVDVVLLAAPPEVTAARRAARGSNQDEAWLAGRRTKVKNLDEYVSIRLDATESVDRLVEALAGHPVFQGENACLKHA